MVATLLSLRLRLLRNTLAREWWRILLLALGIAYALGLLILLLAGLVALGALAPEARAGLLVVGGSALVIGWAVVPVIAFGLDDSLDPRRLAPFIAPSRRLALGLVLAGAVSVPGAATVLAVLATAVPWALSGSGAERAATVLAVVTALVAAATCLALARLTTTAAGGLMQGRRGRDVASLVVVAAVLLLSAVPLVLTQGIGWIFADPQEGLTRLGESTLVQVLGWSPLGSAWAAPAAAAEGLWARALLHTLVAVATLSVVLWAYTRMVPRVMSRAGGASHGTRVRTGGLPLAAWLVRRAPSRPVFGIRVTPAAAAITARSIQYWRTDPRYLANLFSTLVFPVLILILVVLGPSTIEGFPEGAAAWVLVGTAPLVAAFSGWVVHNDVAHDSTAFWLYVSSGVDGVSDRLGRLLGVALWLLPMVTVLAVVLPLVAGRGELVPVALGLTLALLGAGLGVGSVSSVTVPYPAPPPGSNPMASQNNGVVIAVLSQLASFTSQMVLAVPTALTLVLVVIVSPHWGWLTLAVGAATAVACVVWGIRLGGQVYDRRAPRVLATMRSWPRH